MAVQADTNRASLLVYEEGQWGETPAGGALAPRGYEVRMTGETLAHTKNTVVSNVIRNDRMRDSISEVGVSAAGDINFELVFRDLELLIAGAFSADYINLIERPLTGATLTAATANTFTASTGTPFANVVPGADVFVYNFPANKRNNGRFKATAATGTVLTIDPVDAYGATGGTLAAEVAASGTAVIKTAKGVWTTIAATTTGISSAAVNFLTDVNLAVGQWIRIAGFANAGNNGVFRITAIAAGAVTLANYSGTAEAAGPSVTLTARRIRNGTTAKSFGAEERFTDINRYHVMNGLMVNTMTLALESQSIVTGTFSMMGKEDVPGSVTKLGSVTPAGNSQSYNATANVGAIIEGGAPLSTAIRTINLSISNNLRAKQAVANRSPVNMGMGFVDVTGSLNAYFEDDTLYQKFISHAASSLSFRLTDASGNVMIFTLPNLYFTSGTTTAGGGNDDMMVPLEFTAVRDLTTSAVVQLDVLPV